MKSIKSNTVHHHKEFSVCPLCADRKDIDATRETGFLAHYKFAASLQETFWFKIGAVMEPHIFMTDKQGVYVIIFSQSIMRL